MAPRSSRYENCCGAIRLAGLIDISRRMQTCPMRWRSIRLRGSMRCFDQTCNAWARDEHWFAKTRCMAQYWLQFLSSCLEISLGSVYLVVPEWTGRGFFHMKSQLVRRVRPHSLLFVAARDLRHPMIDVGASVWFHNVLLVRVKQLVSRFHKWLVTFDTVGPT